jgi:hypothetical protein
LHLVIRPTGEFVDLTDKSKAKDLKFSKNAPQWRTAGYGLNIEGICNNLDCVASNKQVVCPMGYGVFDRNVDEAEVVCPMCRK